MHTTTFLLCHQTTHYGYANPYNFIYGDNGVVALNLRTSTSEPDTTGGGGVINDSVPVVGKGTVLTDNMYYIHTDHLGSYCALTNALKEVVQRNCFDPWGNVRYIYVIVDSLITMEDDTVSPGGELKGWTPINFTLTNRGFTGHEHYPYFKIINMNGRLYDPVIARFFSPDKYVANSSFTQDFNRYTYARNNPLMYTDPDGEWIHIVVGALLGGIMNVVGNWDNVKGDWGKGAVAFFTGAGQGALTAVCPAAGIIAGGAITGAANSLISQTGKGFSGINNVNWGQVGLMAGVGVASSAIGYGVGQWASTNIGSVVINGFNITSPVIKGMIGGAVGGMAGGYAGGFAGTFLLTGDPKLAQKAGLQGMWTGMAAGAVSGFVGGYAAAKQAGINPWTGKANNSVTIGEGMGRVETIAKDLNSEIIKDMPEAYFGKEINSTYTTSEGMKTNASWIEIKMQNDYYIYDAGPKGNTITSPYYNMEVGRTMVYPNVQNVYHVQQVTIFRILILYP